MIIREFSEIQKAVGKIRSYILLRTVPSSHWNIQTRQLLNLYRYQKYYIQVIIY